jgi:hypothetical protein
LADEAYARTGAKPVQHALELFRYTMNRIKILSIM